MKRIGGMRSVVIAAMVLWVSAVGCGSAKLKKCTGDLAACQTEPKGRVARTGQTACFDAAGAIVPCAGTGQDGELQKGLTRTYVDNGDGTVTDTNTGLMWEKKSDDGSLHDQDNIYTWTAAYSLFIAALNSGGGFAGHTDWRLPNINELRSLPDYGVPPSLGCVNPPVDAVFNTGCTPGCTTTTCSCTPYLFSYYWSSTSCVDGPGDSAWSVLFWCGGIVGPQPKTQSLCARAVRGGS